MDTNCQTDLVNNNLSEVFNNYINDVRNKPIVTMLVGIYDKQMARHDTKREGARTAQWHITPHYAGRLEIMKNMLEVASPRGQMRDCGRCKVAQKHMRLALTGGPVHAGNGK